jgi:hypothetical protein
MSKITMNISTIQRANEDRAARLAARPATITAQRLNELAVAFGYMK